MSKKFDWAKSYIKKYEEWLERQDNNNNVLAGGVEHELYELAKAIVDDVHGEMP